MEYFNQKNCTEAVPYLDSAIENDSQFAEAYYARGACKQNLGSNQKALTDLSEALRIDPSLIDAQALRGIIEFQSDQLDAASKDFGAVLQQRPTDAQSLVGRGAISLKRRRFAAADKDFRIFIKNHPEDPFAPQVREVLASLKAVVHNPSSPHHTGATEAPPQSGEENSEASKARAQALSSAFFRQRNAVSEEFGQRVLRGEHPEAIGDIDSSTQ